jgi:hypothetical protein
MLNTQEEKNKDAILTMVFKTSPPEKRQRLFDEVDREGWGGRGGAERERQREREREREGEGLKERQGGGGKILKN